MIIVELVRDAVTSPTNRNNPITLEIKVLTTLRYLVTVKMQLCIADELGISQSSVSRISHQTINALSRPHILRQFIRFPLDVRQLQRNKAHFMAIAGLPGVVGAIDGTHVQIIAPSQDEHAFVNRKKNHSINTQVVFDTSYNIFDICAKWPGATHDSRILQESGLRQLFERHHVPAGCHLVGDSGYPCRTWLLTPYIHPQSGPQFNYNRAHKKTRSVVERGIGQMKCRFHVLHGDMWLTPKKASRITTVCAILHNLCQQCNIPQPEEYEDDDYDVAATDDDEGGVAVHVLRKMLMEQDHHKLLQDCQEQGLGRRGQEPGGQEEGGQEGGGQEHCHYWQQNCWP
ncbi:putative nuclease HARBI1 [Anguilla anguilla]|uniref:putative nuclease HARBI1 n=1 Tax=Anguilla anguilla TaxID=7936 RepID=UPI0015A95C54|nr:putative nuclease HARBI1 [Anguilla anguilla]